MSSNYTQRARTVTLAEWIELAWEWAHEGGTILDDTTVSSEGLVQRHIIDHGSRIHAVYTIRDVPAQREEPHV